MNKNNWREKILGHLRFARQWLERAEKDFSRDDTLRGELNLSLVEAEVRHAWEMSAGKLCYQEEEEAAKTRTRNWAVGLVLGGVILALGLWRWNAPTPQIPQAQITQSTIPGNPPVELPKQPQQQKSQQSVVAPAVAVEAAAQKVVSTPKIQTPQKVAESTLPKPQPAKIEEKEPQQKQLDLTPPQPKAVEENPGEPSEVEHNLGELTQLAREVLYANTDF